MGNFPTNENWNQVLNLPYQVAQQSDGPQALDEIVVKMGALLNIANLRCWLHCQIISSGQISSPLWRNGMRAKPSRLSTSPLDTHWTYCWLIRCAN